MNEEKERENSITRSTAVKKESGRGENKELNLPHCNRLWWQGEGIGLRTDCSRKFREKKWEDTEISVHHSHVLDKIQTSFFLNKKYKT